MQETSSSLQVHLKYLLSRPSSKPQVGRRKASMRGAAPLRHAQQRFLTRVICSDGYLKSYVVQCFSSQPQKISRTYGSLAGRSAICLSRYGMISCRKNGRRSGRLGVIGCILLWHAPREMSWKALTKCSILVYRCWCTRRRPASSDRRSTPEPQPVQRLHRLGIDWYWLHCQINREWQHVKGLQNRERIWQTFEIVVRRFGSPEEDVHVAVNEHSRSLPFRFERC
jgi:hypothetical protein